MSSSRLKNPVAKTSSALHGRGRSPAARSLLLALGAVAMACGSSQVFRLNPGEEPERYRIVCRDSSRHCDREAKETCEGEYTVLNREMNRPEQKEIEDSDLSSTGPSEGYVGWRSEMVVMCGRELPKLELTRAGDSALGEPVPTAGSQPPPGPTAQPLPMVCTPGATQACLGPGACSGAQPCLRDGSGYDVCDCGASLPLPTPSASAAPGSATASPATATSR
jgi:hypothetical protein